MSMHLHTAHTAQTHSLHY